MRYVVIGGGIAGVCCALELTRCLQQRQHATEHDDGGAFRRAADVAAAGATTQQVLSDKNLEMHSIPPGQVILVSSSSVIKSVREVARLGRLVEELEVVESPLSDLAASAGPGGLLRVVLGTVVGLDTDSKVLRLQDGSTLSYDRLCVCAGARPKELGVPGDRHPLVLTLRDTDSVQELIRRLQGCRRLVLVGNGGIALELVGALATQQAVGRALQQSQLLLQPPSQPPLQPQPLQWPAEAAPPSETDDGGAAESSVPAAGGSPPPESRCPQQSGQTAAATATGPRGATEPGPSEQPELVWVLKHGHVGDAFFDVDAAAFLLRRLVHGCRGGEAGGAAEAPPCGSGGGCGAATGGGGGDGAAGAGGAVDAADGNGGCSGRGRAAGNEAGDGAAAEGRPGAARVWGHAAGPAWTQELLRGLASGQGREGATGSGVLAAGAGMSPPLPPPLPLEGPGARGPGGHDADGGRGSGGEGMSGGGGGSGVGGGGSGGFRVVPEFSATVVRIDEGGAAAAALVAGPDGGGSGSGGRQWEENAGAAGKAVSEVPGGPWPLDVTLSNGQVYGADLVVLGIGVEPATEWLPPQVRRAADGGLAVERDMRTSDPAIFAAGDCCTAEGWDKDREQGSSQHWFQMRLWTQARVMGTYAAHCMLGQADELAAGGFNFELFTHVTRFLGAKVVLLGLYNGQTLEREPREDVRLYSREAPAADGSGDTFVRVLLLRGRMQASACSVDTNSGCLRVICMYSPNMRMQGAVLIGDTELEEVYENLILDGLDLSCYGPLIVDSDFELEHVFD